MIQNFGQKFDAEMFYNARDVAREITYELASSIQPGMTEDDAHKLYKDICSRSGVVKNWHPAKLRFGPNTLKAFKEKSDPYTLQENDIFFLDIGPIIYDHEADYGETFVLGNNPEHLKIKDATKTLFQDVQKYWKENNKNGPELYIWAENRAKELGYNLNLGADGHRIGDFPHHIFFKGAITECPEEILPNAWILEIQLESLDKQFGAFFEDILR